MAFPTLLVPFGRGERPRKGTEWDLVSQKVEKCPKYRNASNVDVMGRAIRCICGYHKPETSPPPVSTVITIHFKPEYMYSAVVWNTIIV